MVGLLLCFVLHQDAAPRPVSVPFELLPTKHMAVQIKINGKGPYRVIFDTGAPVTLINRKIGKASGLIDKNSSAPFLGILGPTPQVTIKTLGLGDVEAKDLPVIVMDHPTIEIMSQAFGGVDGILGFPFFARYKMTLDYQTKQLSFVPSGYEPGDVLQKMLNSVMMRDNTAKRILASSGVWGMRVAKPEGDMAAGVTVEHVYPNSPADKAGLRKDDRIVTIDERWTDSVQDCHEAVALAKPGTAISIQIERGGAIMAIKVNPVSGI